MPNALSQIGQYMPLNLSAGVSMTKTFIWGLIAIGLIIFSAVFVKNRVKYKYYGLIFKRRQDAFDGLPQAMLVQGKAGYFKKRKSGRTVFRIKWGFMPWQQIETSQLPDPKYMLGNTVIILQVQKDNFTQAKIGDDWEGKTFKLEPIDDSLTFDALLEMNEIDKVLDTKKISTTAIGMGIIGLIIITGIIVFYFLKGGG